MVKRDRSARKKKKKPTIKRAKVEVIKHKGFDKKARFEERKAAFDKMKQMFQAADADGDGYHARLSWQQRALLLM